jgi:hypothetical protein
VGDTPAVLHPAAVARTSPEARRGRSLLERIVLRFPPLVHLFIRLGLGLPDSRLRRALLRYAYRRAYAAWNRRDWELNTLAHDDSPYEMTWAEGVLVPGANASYRGVAGYLEFADLWLDSFGEYRFELRDVHQPDRDAVLVLIRQHGVGAGSGAPFVQEMVSADEFDRGRLVHQTIWLDPDAAFRAHGLAPEGRQR